MFNGGGLLFSGIDTKSLDGIEVDSTILDSTTCDIIADGWYIYIAPNENQYIAHVVDGVIVELVDNNVDPVPDQPAYSYPNPSGGSPLSAIDLVVNNVCGNKYIEFAVTILPDGATGIEGVGPGATITYETVPPSEIHPNGIFIVKFAYPDNIETANTGIRGTRDGSCPGAFLMRSTSLSSCG